MPKIILKWQLQFYLPNSHGILADPLLPLPCKHWYIFRWSLQPNSCTTVTSQYNVVIFNLSFLLVFFEKKKNPSNFPPLWHEHVHISCFPQYSCLMGQEQSQLIFSKRINQTAKRQKIRCNQNTIPKNYWDAQDLENFHDVKEDKNRKG